MPGRAGRTHVSPAAEHGILSAHSPAALERAVDDRYALLAAVLNSGLTTGMLRGLGALGLTGLGVLPGPLRYPVGIARPLLRPSDYAGQSIGVQQSLVASSTFRALGAKPVWFAVQAPIDGFGGVEQGINNIQGDRYAKPVTVTANVVLWPRPLVVFANRHTFAALTSPQRRILVQAAVDDVQTETKVDLVQERQSTADLCRGGLVRFVDATPADLVALRRAVEPVYARLDADPENQQQLAQIEAMRSRTSPEPQPMCPTAVPLRVAADRLDGAYRYNLDYAELQAAHADAGEVNSSNVGTFTFVFDGSRFAETVQNPQTCIWGYGTVRLTGAKVSLLFSSGGGTPPGAANSPGESFTLEWSLYRDSLSMRRVPGAISPTPFIVKPWLQISTTPSRNYLSKRCPPPANALPG